MDYTNYRIADPNATILKVETKNNQAQDKADNAFQLEHSTDMWKDWCVDNVIEGHDGVMAQVGEKLNYGHGFKETTQSQSYGVLMMLDINLKILSMYLWIR